MDAIAFIAEQRIREALDRGEFDNLPGAGRPLELEDDSDVPEDLRMACKVLRNAGYLSSDGNRPGSLPELLQDHADERDTVRRMRKLDALLFHMSGQERSLRLPDADSYYEKVVARVKLKK